MTLHDPIESLLSVPPYSLGAKEKRELLLLAMNEAYAHHFNACSAYARYCSKRGFGPGQTFEDLGRMPYLPVQAFKENATLLRSVESAQITTRLSSSATSGVPSSVDLDRVTAKRQVRALASVIGSVLGVHRRPFVVIDVDPRAEGGKAIGARGAAVRGFLNLARSVDYVMDPGPGGTVILNERKLEEALAKCAAQNEPVAIFGFTFVLFASAVRPLLADGKRFALPTGSHVIHIGGWKKLADQQVSKQEFNATMASVFAVKEEHVVDFYGFTEQMGVTYPDGPGGLKYAPAFSEVIVRDPSTFEPLPAGQEGLLEFLTPIPYSYPGIAVLTDDVGVVVSETSPADGWQGTSFRILGRAKKAEARGCGDIMGEKVHRPKARPSGARSGESSGIRLLWGADRNHVGGSLFASVDLESLPKVDSLADVAATLKRKRSLLDKYSVDDLIALVSAAASRWAGPGSSLAPLRQQGLLFLTGWCASRNFRGMADRSLRGQRGYLDGFRPVSGTNRRLLLAQPRGLVAHWLAGNVPLLGMLTLAQSIVTRNANLLKAASSFSNVLPALLDGFRDLRVALPDGRILSGDDVLETVAVVYFPGHDTEASSVMSSNADVRLAWGGKEAIESILNQPKRYGTEDLIFGPKLSYMVIGREMLASERSLRKLARQAATDSSVFDQYACASPHTIFVEKGGAFTPKAFAECLAAEMAKASVRIPKGPVDAGTAAKVESVRMRYEFTGELWRSSGTEWTVLYDDAWESGLAEPCYSRVITVRAVEDVMRAAEFAHSGIQTVGTSLAGGRKLAFAAEAARRGVERFPDIGRMTFFDSPWDGVFPMDRLVKWVTLGGPF